MKTIFKTIMIVSALAAAVSCGSGADKKTTAAQAEVEVIPSVSVAEVHIQEVPQQADPSGQNLPLTSVGTTKLTEHLCYNVPLSPSQATNKI